MAKTMTIEVILDDHADEAAIQNKLNSLLGDARNRSSGSSILNWRPASVAQAESRLQARRELLGIVMEGGNIKNIVAENPEKHRDLDIVLIDYDTCGCDDADLVDVPQGEGEDDLPAYMQKFDVTKEGIGLQGVYEAFLSKDDSQPGPK